MPASRSPWFWLLRTPTGLQHTETSLEKFHDLPYETTSIVYNINENVSKTARSDFFW